MKNWLILFVFTLGFSSISLAQNTGLNSFQLKGKIKAYEIQKVIDSTDAKKNITIEKVEFDNKGIRTAAVYFDWYNPLKETQEKRIVKNNIAIIYKCRCANLDEFISNFSIQSLEKLKKIRGLATNEYPTKFVAIDSLDKNGNIVLTTNYSELGFKNLETRVKYNSMNKVLTRISYENDGYVSREEMFKYGTNGGLLEATEIFNKQDLYQIKHVKKYNSDQEQVESLMYTSKFGKGPKDSLYSHYQYPISKTGDKKEFICLNKISGQRYTNKVINYNLAGQEIEILEYDGNNKLYSRKKNDYLKNGRLKTSLFYDTDNTLSKRVVFEDDENNNWKEMWVYQTVLTINLDNTKTASKKTMRFIQKINYKK